MNIYSMICEDEQDYNHRKHFFMFLQEIAANEKLRTCSVQQSFFANKI